MLNGVTRALVTAGAVLTVATMAATAASATAFTFDTTATANSQVDFKNFVSTVGGTSVNMHVTGWHWNDPGDQKIVSNKLGVWTPGLGVLTSNESSSTNEHQIDNVGGVDFVMLQFDRAVTLTGIGRAVFALPGISTPDSDASYWGDTGSLLGTAATWNNTVDLTKYSVAPSLWADIPGGSTSGTVSVSGAGSAATWLIAANLGNERNDGFKLASVTVNANVAAVPEPASWAMMVGGFGMIGGAMRRRQAATRTTLSFA